MLFQAGAGTADVARDEAKRDEAEAFCYAEPWDHSQPIPSAAGRPQVLSQSSRVCLSAAGREAPMGMKPLSMTSAMR